MSAGRPESRNPKINSFCVDTVSDGEFTAPRAAAPPWPTLNSKAEVCPCLWS